LTDEGKIWEYIQNLGAYPKFGDISKFGSISKIWGYIQKKIIWLF